MASRIADRAGNPSAVLMSTPASRAPPVPAALPAVPPVPSFPPAPLIPAEPPAPGAGAPPWPAGAPPIDEPAFPPTALDAPPVPGVVLPPWLDEVHAASQPLAASATTHRPRVSPRLTGREHIPVRARSNQRVVAIFARAAFLQEIAPIRARPTLSRNRC